MKSEDEPNIGPQRAAPKSPAQLKAIANQARQCVEEGRREAQEYTEAVRREVEAQVEESAAKWLQERAKR